MFTWQGTENGFITFKQYDTDIFSELGKIPRHRSYGIKNVTVQKYIYILKRAYK